MSLLALAILLISIGQYVCVPRNCTRDGLCLHVENRICNNTQCLLLNKTDVDKTVNAGMTPLTWNIGRTSFFSSCPISTNYEKPAVSDGSSALNQVFTLYSGSSCNESTTVISSFTADPDPAETGQIRLLTGMFNGDKYEECYTYFETGKAFVYRRCLVDSSYPPEKACAAVIARKASTETCTSPGLADFVDSLRMEFPRKITDFL